MKNKYKESSSSIRCSQSSRNSNFSSRMQKYITQQTQNQLEDNCQLKFKLLLDKNKLKRIGQIFKQSRGKNTPIQYQESYNFLQRWQTQNKQTWDQNIIFQLPDTLIGLLIGIILLIQKSIIVWGLSVFRIFQLQNPSWLFISGLLLIIVDLITRTTLILRHYFYLKNIHQANFFFTRQNLLKAIGMYSWEIYCLVYYIVCLSVQNSSRYHFAFLFLFDASVAYLQYTKAENLYKKIKIFGIRSAYRNFMNLFDLMSMLFAIFHLCGVLIYGMTKFSSNNWITRIQIQNQVWIIKYIHSWYFTCTTMLTVGYGDIIPVNYIEKIIITFVQILGVALNGYIINEVGHTLSKIRETKQNKQKDISDTQKLAKVYRLNNELAKKMRDYIAHNTTVSQELNIEEQHNLLHKLNDQLRTQVNNQNHLKTIKENIFFIFNFSKKAQLQFAKRLQRVLFSPNQSIYQVLGKEKLYILTKGKVQLYTDKKLKDKFFCKKMVKVIQKTKDKQISDNVFGYSTILYGKPTNLRAITKDFTVCYTLQKSDINQVVSQDQNDFEYFCQLRDKIWMQKYPERWQAPKISSIRYHYSPSVYYLIKKQIKQCRQSKNQRKSIIRYSRIVKMKVSQEIRFEEESDKESSQDQTKFNNQIDQSSRKKISQQQRKFKYQALSKPQYSQASIKNIIPRSYKRKYVNNKKYQEKKRQQMVQQWSQKKQMEQFYFQTYKQYQHYFPKKNLSMILQKMRNKMSIETQLTLIDPKLKSMKTIKASRKRI